MDWYLWIKVAHIVSMISWMVALLYLPRLFVYHSDSDVGSDKSETFKVMESRLMRGILAPAMILTWGFGIWLATLLGVWSDGWFVTKLFLVLLLSFYSFFCIGWMKELRNDLRKRSAKFFRVINEVPAIMMILIVILVVVKPW